uniref:Putative secreted protein n=1 Tax=Anopheles marajoara TaxID=58244 RepID=A0A2M4CE06_9DIPT
MANLLLLALMMGGASSTTPISSSTTPRFTYDRQGVAMLLGVKSAASNRSQGKIKFWSRQMIVASDCTICVI